jgi:hypothetical protein
VILVVARCPALPKWSSLFKKPTEDALRAIVIVVTHTVVLFVLLGCIKLMELYLLWLWNEREPAIVGVPISQVVMGSDIAVLLTFLGTATFKAARAFWR